MAFHRFTDTAQILAFAEQFLRGRIGSLEQDIDYCLRDRPYAPFPALLYCFAIIDLLGALYAGRADRFAPTTNQAANYMTSRFMRYTDEQVRLLQNIFRHKLVHLSEPKAVIEDNGRLIAWRYVHESSPMHLQVYRLPNAMEFFILPPAWTVTAEYEFAISIRDLVRDIRESVLGAGAYLGVLRGDIGLQQNFESAIIDIFDPAR